LAGSKLRSLSIADDPKITLAGVQTISQIHSLHQLSFNRSPMTDAGFASLKSLVNLKGLSFYQGVNLGATALTHIGELKNLEYLSLDEVKLTPAGAASLSQLSNLKQINMNQPTLDDTWVKALAKLKNLERATIAPKCSPAALRELAQLPHLTYLFL